MLTHRLLTSALVGCLAITVAACGGGSSGPGVIADSSLVVDNQSDFVIEELYLTPNYSGSWGPNLLRGDVLFPDENITLGVDCGTYDALVVDEDGVDCQLNDLDLCLNDAVWVIRNNTCSVFGAAARERAANKARDEAATQATTAAQ